MTTTRATRPTASPSSTRPTPETVSPTLLRPLNGEPIDAGAAAFAWTPLPGVRRYRVQVSAAADFEAVVLDADIQDAAELTVYDLFAENGALWYWRVRADGGAWSPAERFVAAGPDALIAHHEALRAADAQRRKETRLRQTSADADALPPYRTGTTSRTSVTLLTAVAAVGLLMCILIVVIGGAGI